MGVLVRALVRGLARVSSSSIRTPISGQYYCSRGGKTFSYHVLGASSMLPHVPLKLSRFHFRPFRHLTASRGEGAASEWRGTDLRPECLKPPDSHIEGLEKSGRASAPNDSPILLGSPGAPDPVGLAAVSENAGMGDVEPSRVNAHERGGAPPVVVAASTGREYPQSRTRWQD